MEDISNFFNSKQRQIVAESRVPKKLTLRDDHETTYAHKHIVENRSQMLQSSRIKCADVDDDARHEIDDDIYDRYNFKIRTLSNCNLSILLQEQEILEAIDTNAAIVLHGPTGSGKTTQVPQFILDDACAKRKYCSIVVTQPRRIAASSNANRVAIERGWKPGTVVGYQIGLDQRANFTEDTRILYCTTGVLLERLVHARDFGDFTHIVIDEVHERSKEIDFLLIIIKKLLATATTKPNVKFILMSATFDADAFAKYFELPIGDALVPAKIIRVQQKSNYKVSEFYLDDLMTLSSKSGNIQFMLDEPGIDDELYSMAVNLIIQFENIDAEEYSMFQHGMKNPTVLIFLPGINEINRMRSELMEKWSKSKLSTKLLCLVLHSMSNDHQHQQVLAIKSTEENVRKIILATNIAESSITVPDVKYVIDFCLTRTMVTDRGTNFTSLQLNWTARNNCMQRMGRAGRVMDGRCYRLVTKYFYENLMLDSLPPELIRNPLEHIVLKAKKMNMGSPDAVLALAMDKPKLSDIATTILILKEAGALMRNCAGVYTELDGDLTFVGRIMADLPIDIKISRLIMFGYCFGVVEECLVIGAALSCSKKIFKWSDSQVDGMRLYALQLQWANGSGSDLFAMHNAYKVWSQKCNCNQFGVSNSRQTTPTEIEWADKFGINLAAMYECKQLIEELKNRLECLGINAEDSAQHVRWNDNDKFVILKTVIAGAFYPNFFVRNTSEDVDFARNAFHDPCNTVYFKRFPRNNIRCLYTKAIKNIFIRNGVVNAERSENIRVLFDDSTEKAYVSFQSMARDVHKCEYGVERMPGNIAIELVYKAVKMRKLRMQTNLRLIKSTETEKKYARDCGLEIDQNYKQIINLQYLDRICVPRVLVESVVGYVTHIRTCSQFWFQPMEQFYECKSFNKALMRSRKNLVKRFDRPAEISVGQMLLVKTRLPNETAAEYCRAKVLNINSSWRQRNAYRLFLIDFGITDYFEFDYLRDPQLITSDFMKLPPRCFECTLAELQPSKINCPDGVWPTEAIKIFEEFANDSEIEADIYSVANGVVHVFIHPPVSNVNLNDSLIELGFAEFAKESYASQTNHKERLEKQNDSTAQSRENHLDASYIKHLSHECCTEVPLPPPQMCSEEIRLQGPFSPLEISLKPLIDACMARTVKVDSHSVNSVLLDNDPHEKYERYIVAASVSDTPKMTDIAIRATTLMPNIRAFGPLMALIFCPTMEMKRNHEKTKYVAIRTGLGYDCWNERPVFEEHDIVFNLDTEITIDDIEEINQIRYCLNTLLHTLPTLERSKCSVKEKVTITVTMKELIIKLLGKSRTPIEMETETFSWNSYDTDEIVKSNVDDIDGDRAIFPFHRVVKIYTTDELYADEMRKHCDHLEMLAKRKGHAGNDNKKILCKLCMRWMDTLSQLRDHLRSPGHFNKYYKICED